MAPSGKHSPSKTEAKQARLTRQQEREQLKANQQKKHDEAKKKAAEARKKRDITKRQHLEGSSLSPSKPAPKKGKEDPFHDTTMEDASQAPPTNTRDTRTAMDLDSDEPSISDSVSQLELARSTEADAPEPRTLQDTQPEQENTTLLPGTNPEEPPDIRRTLFEETYVDTTLNQDFQDVKELYPDEDRKSVV